MLFRSFLVNNGEWPDKNRNASQLQMDQQIYLNVLLARKAKTFGVEIPDDSVIDAASQMLRSAALARAFGTPNQAVPMDKFVEYILKPKGFTSVDFLNAVRQQLMIEQLRLTRSFGDNHHSHTRKASPHRHRRAKPGSPPRTGRRGHIGSHDGDGRVRVRNCCD